MIAFDADVIIYAAAADHPLGVRVLPLFAGPCPAGIGSTLLLPEVLSKPLRTDPGSEESAALLRLLGRLELRPLDEPTGRLSLDLAITYGLRAADAAHLATAVAAGADQFLTNNHKDFPRSIAEIDIVYPDDLLLRA